MKVTGLFAGIGGIELGLHLAGHETLLLCESDPAARMVLRDQPLFKGIPLNDDVTTLTDLPGGTDLLTSGFPCQDLSQVGKTDGINGLSSGLVRHVFRLLRDHPVPWVLIENVPFMLSLGRGAAMEFLVSNFEELGYRWAYRVVDSRSFGLPQRRRRVYLFASLEESPEKLLLAEDSGPPETPPYRGTACGFYWTEGSRGLGWAVDAVPPLKGGSGLGIPSPPAIWFPDGAIGTPDVRDAERLQGFEPCWTSPAATVGRPSHRWKLIGNAVSVPAAAWCGARLMAKPAAVEGTPLCRGSSWPKAAFGSSDGRYSVKASEWPVRFPSPGLEEFLQFPLRPLSRRATMGFLTRVKASSLRCPPEFLQALEEHLGKTCAPA